MPKSRQLVPSWMEPLRQLLAFISASFAWVSLLQEEHLRAQQVWLLPLHMGCFYSLLGPRLREAHLQALVAIPLSLLQRKLVSLQQLYQSMILPTKMMRLSYQPQFLPKSLIIDYP